MPSMLLMGCCCDDAIELDCSITPFGQCQWTLTLTISGNVTAGSYTITLGGQTTAAIPYNAAPVTIATTYLRPLSSIFHPNVSPTSASVGYATITSTSTLKVYKFTFVAANQDAATLTATTTASLTGGTATVGAPSSPARVAAAARKGRYKLQFSGVTMPSSSVVGAIPWYVNTSTAPAHPDDPVFRAYSTDARKTVDVVGSMPSTVYLSAMNGLSTIIQSTTRNTRLLDPAIGGDWAIGDLYRYPCQGSFASYDAGIQRTYLGQTFSLDGPASLWPYAKATTPGIAPGMTLIEHTIQFTQHAGNTGGFGGSSDPHAFPYMRMSVVATTYVHFTNGQLYPTYVGGPGITPPGKQCEGFGLIIPVSRVWLFAGICQLSADGSGAANESFPCDRASWTFTNEITTAGQGLAYYDNSKFGVGTGGTCVVTPEACAEFGDSMPTEYTLAMNIGQPATASGTGTPISGPASEAVAITLKRYPIANFDQDASNLRRESVAYGPVWYGETTDGLFRATLSAYMSGESGDTFRARLAVERQQPYLDASGNPREGGRQLRFETDIIPGNEFEPPENTLAHPRYDLVSAAPRGGICASSPSDIGTEINATLQPSQYVDERFSFTIPLLTAGTTDGSYPVRTTPVCATSYKVAWKLVPTGPGTSTYDVQVLAATASTPTGYDAEIVTREPARCYGHFRPFQRHLYANKHGNDRYVGISDPTYRYVALLPGTMSGINYGQSYVSPPVWQAGIQFLCPQNTTIVAHAAAGQTSECPTTGVYDLKKCLYVTGDTCNDCAGDCSVNANTIRVTINIPDNAMDAWNERHGEEGIDPPVLIFDTTRVAGCLWKAASAGTNAGMTTKAVRCEFERVGATYEIRVYRPPEGSETADVLVYRAVAPCTAFQKPENYLDTFVSDGGQTLYNDAPPGETNTPLAAVTD